MLLGQLKRRAQKSAMELFALLHIKFDLKGGVWVIVHWVRGKKVEQLSEHFRCVQVGWNPSDILGESLILSLNQKKF